MQAKPCWQSNMSLRTWSGIKNAGSEFMNWNPRKNYVWIQGAVDRNATFKAVSRRVDDYLWDKDNRRFTMYKNELDQIEGSGLRVVEDFIKFND